MCDTTESIRTAESELLGYFLGFVAVAVLLVPLLQSTPTRPITVAVGGLLFLFALVLTDAIPTVTTPSRWYVLIADVLVFLSVAALITFETPWSLDTATLRQFALLITISILLVLTEIGVDANLGGLSQLVAPMLARLVFYLGAIVTAIYGPTAQFLTLAATVLLVWLFGILLLTVSWEAIAAKLTGSQTEAAILREFSRVERDILTRGELLTRVDQPEKKIETQLANLVDEEQLCRLGYPPVVVYRVNEPVDGSLIT